MYGAVQDCSLTAQLLIEGSSCSFNSCYSDGISSYIAWAKNVFSRWLMKVPEAIYFSRGSFGIKAVSVDACWHEFSQDK